MFLLFVMSHGDENGIIHTDVLKKDVQPKPYYSDLSDFEEYSINDIFEAVNSNLNLTSSLKIIVIQVFNNIWWHVEHIF